MGDDLKLDLTKFSRKVDKNTVAVFCSYPDQYFGIMDPVKSIAEFAAYSEIGCHVDCNYSSFLLNVDSAVEIQNNYANFQTPGITTIGVSLNRY
mmetsp:Transcript_41221/g.47480  ORF Transcript_41221/g.47480 Transcript_41221/m.47480 type:complete len:94 (+) Transcript_41221:642-923(+)